MLSFKQGLLGALVLAVAAFTSNLAFATSCPTFTAGTVMSGNDPFGGPAPCGGFLNNSPSLFKYNVDGPELENGKAGGDYTDDFTITIQTPATGTWSYDPDPGQLFPKFVVFKSADEWTFIEIALGVLSGSWNLNDFAFAIKDLSHISFYDGQTPPGGSGELPLPGAIWLMGTVLAGGAGVGAWRRRRQAAASA